MRVTNTPEQTSSDEPSVQLRDPELSAFLAWLIPGLGHLYQGRTAKAILFFVCIMGTFVYGLYLGSSSEHRQNAPYLGWGRVVYFSWGEDNKRLPYLCQIGVGLPALPALVQAYRADHGKKVWWHGFMAPPRLPGTLEADPNADQPTAADLNLWLHRYFELGTVYTMIAGLLNVLAIYDAWGGPVFGERPRKKETEDEEADVDQHP
jgi:hypothetical protein